MGNVRKCYALMLLIAFSAIPAAAAPSGPLEIPYPNSNDRGVVPVGSPIHYSGITNRDGGNIATFYGQVLLTGTYYYGDNDFNDSGDDRPSEYVFDPQAYILLDG